MCVVCIFVCVCVCVSVCVCVCVCVFMHVHYLQICLHGVIDGSGGGGVELWHEVVEGEVVDGWLVPCLLCVYQHPHTSTRGTLNAEEVGP